MVSTPDNTGGTADRIVAIAATLFAEHGYHGLSMRALAAAVGLNVATIHYHSDDDIAHPVTFLRRLYALVDALVDLTIEQPETPRLWLRRWLEQDESPAAIEAEVSLPLYDMALDLLERAQAAGTIRSSGVDLRMMLTGFIWILYGYFAGSPLDASGARVDPLHPEQIAAFKRFLHAYTARMLGLPEEHGEP